MAIRAKGTATVRRTSHRREQQVQEFTDEEIQSFKKLLAAIRKAVDSHRDSHPERSDGPIWASLYIGLGPSSRKVHHSLPSGIFRSVGLRGLYVGTAVGLFPEDSGEDKPTDSPAERGGSHTHAKACQRCGGRHTSVWCPKSLQRRRR